jgi:GDPmannose 4,6-dehydratase
MKKIFITGVSGQDGTLMAKKQLSLGNHVIGGYREGPDKLWRHDLLEISGQIQLVDYEIGNFDKLSSLFDNFIFDEIYHFAGYSLAEDSLKIPKQAIETNLFGVLELLELIKNYSVSTKIFISGSSEIFGNNQNIGEIYNEDSVLNPNNFYGISHAASKMLCDLYRTLYGLKIFYGILFNHESALRNANFLTKKLALGFEKLKKGDIEFIEIGNFDSCRDWGSATDYIEAMVKLMSTAEYGNYIISTGQVHSVKDLVSTFASCYGYQPYFEMVNGQMACRDKLTNKVLVRSTKHFMRKNESLGKIGSNLKLKRVINFSPKSDIAGLVSELINLNLLK